VNLEAKAAEIRRALFENALAIGKGHVASSLSWVEIAVALFYGGMQPEDRFVLSKTHGHLTLDAILTDLNFTADKLMWPGWPAVCSGSLGQGLGMAAGIALAAKIDGSTARTFCVLSDAELHEGAIWEAAMFVGHHRLNLTAIIDDNQQSCANFTRDVLSTFPIRGKFEAFGWPCNGADGHDIPALKLCFSPKVPPGPRCIIAQTLKGKGIPFMEGNPKWHHQLPQGDEIECARKALA
jgi:transketolase